MDRLDKQHKKLHLEVLDLIKDDADGVIELKEQKDYEEYDNTVDDIQGHIQMMLFDIEAEKLASLVEAPVDPMNKLHKQLSHIDDDLGKVRGVIDSMVAGTSVIPPGSLRGAN